MARKRTFKNYYSQQESPANRFAGLLSFISTYRCQCFVPVIWQLILHLAISQFHQQPANVHINAQIIYTRALRIIFPEKPVNPALIHLTICNQTGCECIVCASNPSLMTGCVFMVHEFHEFSCKRAQPKMSRKGAFYIDQWVECAVFTVLAAQVGRAASPIVAHSPGQRPGERCRID